ncbi:ThuA domain-containing protein [Fodinibius sediminis]|uniref:ThuA-like domain-containing protein n=1 Tax=Fodinibius sediminis TaxID=1214077 RepID=A0A521ARS1_9BACT|nr:ThuA domain-containing protein [Fodinibius sediminis]SMO37507.1 hypothetical protein SAMN06265218_101326 [Fodinibius sediminis]
MLKQAYFAPLLKIHPLALLLICALSFHASAQQASQAPSVLIFSKTEGFRHSSIPTGVKAIMRLADENDIKSYHTENAGLFNPDSLSTFDAVIFLNTTGNVLDDTQQAAFEEYLRSGGGFLGVHAAADTEYEWPWYGEMVGAYFKNHPRIQEASIKVVNQSHAATSFLPEEWVRTDEWYNYKDISNDINVLMKLDEDSYEGGENGTFHPIAWYHDFEGGRVFYTGLGHTKEAYSEPLFLDHLSGALKYVLGTATAQ